MKKLSSPEMGVFTEYINLTTTTRKYSHEEVGARSYVDISIMVSSNLWVTVFHYTDPGKVPGGMHAGTKQRLIPRTLMLFDDHESFKSIKFPPSPEDFLTIIDKLVQGETRRRRGKSDHES